MKILECKSCGAKVEVVTPCTCENCGIMCCGKNMEETEIDTAPSKETISCGECGAVVNVIEPCTCDDCGIMCCGKAMK